MNTDSLQEAHALHAAVPAQDMRLVPLTQLRPRPSKRNVRTNGRTSIPELAASILRVGLLQNLTAVLCADGEYYEVVAGGRRLTALKLLAKKKRIAHDYQVPCLLVADASARTASLTENVQREATAPGRPVRGLRWFGGRGPARRRHCGRLRRVALGDATPFEARQCVAAPAGRLPHR